MAEENAEQLAEQCITVILKDIHLRSGLGASWRMISPDVREDIIKMWKFDVAKAIEDSKVSFTKPSIPGSK